jgi:hypothetical protein
MLTFFSNAQEEVYSTIPYDFGRWIGEGYMVPDGDKAYVFADACNVRKEPKPNAEIVGKLYIGTEVEILRRMEVELTLNGVESTWLKVKSDTIVGYVWGGTLTNQVLELPDKRLALWGITKYVDTDTSRFATASIRIAANKVMVSSVDLDLWEELMEKTGIYSSSKHRCWIASLFVWALIRQDIRAVRTVISITL